MIELPWQDNTGLHLNIALHFKIIVIYILHDVSDEGFFDCVTGNDDDDDDDDGLTSRVLSLPLSFPLLLIIL